MVGVLADLSDQAVDFGGLGDVGWNRDSFAGEWERVESGASFLACCGFARCDEDFGAAGLDEAGWCELWITDGLPMKPTQTQREGPVLASHQ